ncbi:hypothetical protein PMAYCL1PPCAC_17060 [Pristionchus mayeri]|uniref:Hydrolase n=1 Tax=Pristionchus mayeri TaxID=1317129 RepID=A0AAN5CLX3_9BILA|nr:hypothetical protein PMAYCL1PPCAC_17060 [Pristionchus mayeri]
MFLADNPSFNGKIRSLFALAPAGSIHYTRGLARLILMSYPILNPLFRLHRLLFGPQQVGNQIMQLIGLLAERVCLPLFSQVINSSICDPGWIWVAGPPSPSFNKSRQAVYLSHYPDGTSSMVIEHFGQMAVADEIRHFDPDFFSDAYKARTALYNYSNIDVPIYIFWSRNDWLTSPYEIDRVLFPRMRKGVIKATYEVPLYNHADFLYATDNAERVFSGIVKLIKDEELGNQGHTSHKLGPSEHFS